MIACNTASACALETVKQELDIPIIGVIYAGAQHRLLRFASIWNARRISKVYDALLRHLAHDLTGYRQTADA